MKHVIQNRRSAGARPCPTGARAKHLSSALPGLLTSPLLALRAGAAALTAVLVLPSFQYAPEEPLASANLVVFSPDEPRLRAYQFSLIDQSTGEPLFTIMHVGCFPFHRLPYDASWRTADYALRRPPLDVQWPPQEDPFEGWPGDGVEGSDVRVTPGAEWERACVPWFTGRAVTATRSIARFPNLGGPTPADPGPAAALGPSFLVQRPLYAPATVSAAVWVGVGYPEDCLHFVPAGALAKVSWGWQDARSTGVAQPLLTRGILMCVMIDLPDEPLPPRLAWGYNDHSGVRRSPLPAQDGPDLTGA